MHELEISSLHKMFKILSSSRGPPECQDCPEFSWMFKSRFGFPLGYGLMCFHLANPFLLPRPITSN